MVKRLFILILLIISAGLSRAQDQDSSVWHTLAKVDTESKFDDLLAMVIVTARPKEEAAALQGTEIQLKGYMISLDIQSEKSNFLFSRYTQNMCFFCGAAGPESAMEVFMKNKVKIPHTTEQVTLKGLLHIKPADPSGLIYTLTEAELIESKS